MSSVELLKLVDPTLFYSKFIAGGVFPDGRAIDTFKPFSFKRGVVGDVVAGSALVRQGGVTVVCSLHACLSPRSTESIMTAEWEGGGGEDAHMKMALVDARSLLDELTEKEAFLTREALTSTDSRLEWRLTAKFRLLHSEGDVCAAVVGALLAALTDGRLPQVQLQHDKDDESPIEPTQVTIEKDESKWYRLQLSSYPVASTFMLHVDEEGKMNVLADPPEDARQLCKSQCMIVIGRKEKTSPPSILSFRSQGSHSDELLRRMVSIAERRQESIVNALEREE